MFATDASATHGGKVTFEGFETYLVESDKVQKSFDDILQAFKVFESKDKPGHIRIDEFTHALTTLGDKLTRQEVRRRCKKSFLYFLKNCQSVVS